MEKPNQLMDTQTIETHVNGILAKAQKDQKGIANAAMRWKKQFIADSKEFGDSEYTIAANVGLVFAELNRL